MRVAVFRWRAVVPLLVCAALGAGGWVLFADRIARGTAEEVGTAVVGARVEIRKLHLDLARGSVRVGGLTVASPFEPLQNLLEADELVADVALLPLLEKKVVIDRLAAKGLRFATARTTPGTPGGRTGGRAAEVMRQVKDWSQRVQVPALQLATGKISVGQLDPPQLATPRAAEALALRADSAKQAWSAALQGLNLSATLDSANRMVERLRGAKATDLRLLNDGRRTLDQVTQVRGRLTALDNNVAGGVAALQAQVAALDDAKQRDYGFARELLKLPSLDAPGIGAALFGPVAISRFERVLYWAQLARRYMPPGLLPKADPGPRRARRAGDTVRFPRVRAYPRFLLRSAELSFQLAAASASPKLYSARLTGLTSDPALYGRPTTFEVQAPAVQASGFLDHVRGTPNDTAAAAVQGIALPVLALPSLPVRLDTGTGTVMLSFALRGDSLRARWSVRSNRVRWTRDTSAQGRGPAADLVWRVVSGIPSLEVAATLGGTLTHPRLGVGSNLDQALAERLRAVAGAEAASAERKLRARVDSIAQQTAAPVRAQVASLTGDMAGRLASQRSQFDQVQKSLEQRLRELARGVPGVRLP